MLTGSFLSPQCYQPKPKAVHSSEMQDFQDTTLDFETRFKLLQDCILKIFEQP